MAEANPLRFSTKFADDESTVVNYGHRCYSPALGRWICRDPAEENGGLHLYGFVRNSPVITFDPDGRTPQQLLALSRVGGVAAFADDLFTYSTFTSIPGMSASFGGMGSYLDGIAAGLCIGVDIALGGRLLKHIGGPDVFASYRGLGGWLGVPRVGIARLGRQQALAGAVVSGRLSAVAAVGNAARAQATGAGPGIGEIDAAAYGFLQAARRGDTAYAELDAALLGLAVGREQLLPLRGGFTKANLLNAGGLFLDMLNGDAADAFSRLPSYQALNAWDMATEMEDLVEGW
jgi:RHS repeat-associated protein